MIGANLYETNSKNGTVSNSYGFYSLQVPKGKQATIAKSYLGYTSITEKIDPIVNQKLDFLLYSRSFELEEVELTASKDIPIEKRNEIGVLSIPVEQIKTQPARG